MDDRKNNPERDDPPQTGPHRMPIPPDPARVHAQRARMEQERKARSQNQGRAAGRSGDAARRARDIGTYTLIPMLMLAGPAVGYVLGLLVQKYWGGEPWAVVVGLLVGLVAGFRQVFLLLARFHPDDKDHDRDGDAE